MRKGYDGEKKTRKEKNGEYSGPLTSLPVDRLNGDRLQRRRSCQFLLAVNTMSFIEFLQFNILCVGNKFDLVVGCAKLVQHRLDI